MPWSAASAFSDGKMQEPTWYGVFRYCCVIHGMILFAFDLHFVHRNNIFSNHAPISVLIMSTQKMTDMTQLLTGLSTLHNCLVTCSFEQGVE